ncbi:MAG: hypothetical protein GY809_10630, partial [Planctomycetes bacterium]|nr:hypothetical protein [Planctomycetota bacterium]
TALIEDPDFEYPRYSVYLEGLALKDDSFITLDSQSTALAIIWNALGVDRLIPESSLVKARDLFNDLEEIIDLGLLLEAKLAEDPFILNTGDVELQDQMELALLATAQLIEDGIADGSLSYSAVPSARMISPMGLFRADTIVTPSEVDDIKVYERDNTGNLSLENDTQLYLSTQITTSDGTVLRPHISGVRSMAGPQGYGL